MGNLINEGKSNVAINYPFPNIPVASPPNFEYKPANPLDIQYGGNHYKNFVIQPVEFITKNNLGFCVGNVIKYICRYKGKDGLADLEKAKHYIDLLIELEYRNVSNKSV